MTDPTPLYRYELHLADRPSSLDLVAATETRSNGAVEFFDANGDRVAIVPVDQIVAVFRREQVAADADLHDRAGTRSFLVALPNELAATATTVAEQAGYGDDAATYLSHLLARHVENLTVAADMAERP